MLYTLIGHNDTITSLSLSPNGHYIASNGMDNTGRCDIPLLPPSLPLSSFPVMDFPLSLTVRIWDIRPFTQDQRQLKVLYGAQHNFEKVETSER